jgi:hypothetical protein
MVLEEPKLLLPSLVSVIIGSFVSIVMIVPLIIFDVIGRAGVYVFGIFIIAALFISYVISYFFMGISSYAVYEHVKNGRSSLRKATSNAFSRSPTLLLLALTAAILTFIVRMLKNRSSRSSRRRGAMSIAGGFLAGVIQEGWDVASRLLVPVAVITGLGYVDTIKKSFDIVKNNLVVLGVGEVGIRIITGLFGFFGSLLSIGIGVGLFLLITEINTLMAIGVGVVVAIFGILLISTLNLFVRTSYYTLLYLWAVEGIEHGSITGDLAIAATQTVKV